MFNDPPEILSIVLLTFIGDDNGLNKIRFGDPLKLPDPAVL